MKPAVPIGFLLVALSVPVGAQQTDLFALRDSLARMTEVPALYRLQSRLPMPGSAQSADQLLARGLIGLRIHELTRDRDDSRRAVESFERAVAVYPRLAWAHYGLARALVGAPEVRVPSPGGVLDGVTLGQSIAEIFGKDARSKARRSLRRALEVDPAFGPAATLLAELAARDGRDRDALLDARDALLAARAAGSSSPDVVRAIADVEVALGNYGAAQAAAERSLAEGGDASALHAQSVALLLQDGNEDAGAAAYFKGIDVLTPDAAQRYYIELDALLTSAEAADWKVADLEGKKLWLRRFWARRGADGGVTEAARLAEHYRRYAQARQRYLRNSVRGLDGAGVLLAPERVGGNPFDERGVVLIRHGEPATVVKTTARGLLPNETWVYGRGADGSLMFHFVALRGARDYTLVTDLFQTLDPASVLNVEDRERAVMTLVEDRAAYEPRYQAAAGRLRRVLQTGYPLTSTEVRSITEAIDAEYRQDVREALDADTYFVRFEQPLPFHYDLFTFRSPSGRTELTAAFAVPADRVSPQGANAPAALPMRLSVILIDTLSGAVTRADTVQPVSPRARADGYARAHVTFVVTPSEHTTHRVLVQDVSGKTGQLFGGPARLRDYNSSAIMVSDIVLAEPDSVGDWKRGDLQLALTLPRRFRPAQTFKLFYEVYNLRTEQRYRTRITVQPAEGGGAFGRLRSTLGMGRGGIDLRFDDVAAPSRDGVIQEVRDLGSELRPGRYRLRVVVTDEASRATASTETIFEVIG